MIILSAPLQQALRSVRQQRPAMGSRYYALPAGCGPYPYGGFTYYSCGSIWYKPTYQGYTVVYVVVAKPY